MSSNLKLIAQDEEQLTIISSLTQDSIVKTNEMGYDNKTKRFALLMNRYRHEEEDPSRIRCAIHFDYADTVKSIGIEKQSNDDILVLLAIRFESKVKPSGSIFTTNYATAYWFLISLIIFIGFTKAIYIFFFLKSH